jgi:hypothetical protein
VGFILSPLRGYKPLAMFHDPESAKRVLTHLLRARGGTGNVLFDKRAGAAVHTDLAQHLTWWATLAGRQPEICAVKIWRERSGLDFPSPYLALTVLHALAAERFGQLADNVLTVLCYISHRFEQAAVHDPANFDNVVWNDLSGAEKKAIAKAARDALYDENWKKILW